MRKNKNRKQQQLALLPERSWASIQAVWDAERLAAEKQPQQLEQLLREQLEPVS